MLTFLLRALGFLPKKVPHTPAPVVQPENIETVVIETQPAADTEVKVPTKRGRKPRQGGTSSRKKAKSS